MKHQTYQPHSDLSAFVKWYWSLEIPAEDTPKRNTIIPDGSIKMIFHWADTYKHHRDDGHEVLLPKSFVIGQLTKPYEVEPMWETGTFIICFQPNGFEPFTSVSIKEMENTAISIERLFSESWEKLSQSIHSAANNQERIEVAEAFLFKILSDSATTDRVLSSAIETIKQSNGALWVDEISEKVRANRRQIERKFSNWVWLTPKQLSKITRMQWALKALLINDEDSFSRLAYKNQYHDQAHFNKDFKEFTGLTPKEFYGDDLKMSLIFESEE